MDEKFDDSESYAERLYRMCSSGTLEQVKNMLLSSDSDEMYMYEECLVRSVDNNDISIVDFFINSGYISEYTRACIAATRRSSTERTMRFLRLGVDVTQVIEHTFNHEILKKIISPGIRADSIIKSLELSVENGEIESVRMILPILKKKCFLSESVNVRLTNIVLKNNYYEILGILTTYNMCTFSHDSLHLAVLTGNLSLIERVLNSSAQTSGNISRAILTAESRQYTDIKLHLEEFLKNKHFQEKLPLLIILSIISFYAAVAIMYRWIHDIQ